MASFACQGERHGRIQTDTATRTRTRTRRTHTLLGREGRDMEWWWLEDLKLIECGDCKWGVGLY